MHQNIAGLFNKSDLLTLYVDEINEQHNIDLDVLCITEHFISAGQEDLLSIPNFNLAACYSRPKNRGGACILVRNGITYNEINVTKFCVESVFECCAIELKQYDISLVCLYRVPNFKRLNLFYEILEQFLSKICNTRNKVVLCGDFNIDILKNNRISLEFENLLLCYNLKLVIRQPTRLSSNSCIDNFAIHSRRNCKSQVLDIGLSDHTAQLLTYPVCRVCKIGSWTVSRRDFCCDNLSKFKLYMESLSFSEIYQTKNADNAFNLFFDTFVLFYDLCFPKIKLKLTIKRKPKWISKGIKLCSKKQRELLWAYRRRSNTLNKINLKIYSNRLKKIIKLTQLSQNSHNIKKSTNKSKTIWQIINRSKLNKPCENITNITSKNINFKDPQDIATAFNDYFIDQINPSINKTLNNNKIINSSINSIYISPTIPLEVDKIIKSLKNKKSTGYDDISVQVIKLVSNSISPHLSYIINLGIADGIFPERLKPVVIKPIYKNKGKKMKL